MPSLGRWRTVDLPPEWDTVIRPFILRRDQYCRWGLLPSDGVAAGFRCNERSTEVDHMGEPDNHNPALLRGLCSPHHATRTGRQGGANRWKYAAKRKRPQERHPGFK